ncbi:MAG: hypothetical protein ACRC6G_00980, partial [Deefgea sp.]
GTACTPEHVRKLLKLADEVVFGFDGGKAGIKAAWRALENSLPEVKDGKELKFLFLPAEHDPDSYVQAFGREQFELLITESALPLSQYLLKELAAQVDLTMEEGRARLVHIARPYLDELTQAPILKLMIGKRLAEMCQLSSAEFASLQAVTAPPKVQAESWMSEPEAQSWQGAPPWSQNKPARRDARAGGSFQRGWKGKGWKAEEHRPRLRPAGQYDPVARALELVIFRPSILLGQEAVELAWPNQGLSGLARAVFTVARQFPDLQSTELLERCRELPVDHRLFQALSEPRALFEKFDEEELQIEIANSLSAATQKFSLGSTLSRKEELDFLNSSRGLTEGESQEYLALLMRH